MPTATTSTRPALDRCLSVRETARYLAVAPRKVRLWVRRGQLRAIDVGNGRLRIEPGAIADLAQLLAVKPDRRSTRRDSGIDPSVAALLGDA